MCSSDLLKAKSVSKIGVQGFLARLSDAPLDDLSELGLADRLEGGGERASAAAPAANAAGPSSPPPRSRKWLIGGIIAVLLAGIAAAVVVKVLKKPHVRSKEKSHAVLSGHR